MWVQEYQGNTEEGNEGPMSPVFFLIQDLKEGWDKQYPNKELPTIQAH